MVLLCTIMCNSTVICNRKASPINAQNSAAGRGAPLDRRIKLMFLFAFN